MSSDEIFFQSCRKDELADGYNILQLMLWVGNFVELCCLLLQTWEELKYSLKLPWIFLGNFKFFEEE